MARTADLLPDQVRGQRAAVGQGLGGAGEQGVVILLQGADGLYRRRQVGDIEQLVDAFAAR